MSKLYVNVEPNGDYKKKFKLLTKKSAFSVHLFANYTEDVNYSKSLEMRNTLQEERESQKISIAYLLIHLVKFRGLTTTVAIANDSRWYTIVYHYLAIWKAEGLT